MKKLIVLNFLLVLVAACGPQKGKDGKRGYDGYSILKQETYGGRETEGYETITSLSGLETLYKELGIENVPAIDFTKNNIVAIFMG
ncbi:hypothetical protein [Flavobacterium rhizosphaerae]|uniref:Uncharacterized protein n=1 Tax=Flavobacterium rhizosphaerae TaxID=3163298 RepID=A0ABW8YT69_9FLAO